jgi:hypothetical protein
MLIDTDMSRFFVVDLVEHARQAQCFDIEEKAGRQVSIDRLSCLTLSLHNPSKSA